MSYETTTVPTDVLRGFTAMREKRRRSGNPPPLETGVAICDTAHALGLRPRAVGVPNA